MELSSGLRIGFFAFPLIAIAAATVVGLRSSSPKGVPRETPHETTRQLSDRISRLEADLSRRNSETETERLWRDRTEEQRVDPAAAATGRIEAPDRMKEMAEANRKLEQKLGDGFQQERRDVQWGSETEAKMTEVLSSPSLAVKTIAADCRTTICRVQLQHEKADSQATLARAISKTPPFDFGVYYFHDTEGRTTTLYVMRDQEQASSAR